MKILFDHQIFSRQQYGGISRYFANIYHSIQNSTEFDARISVLHTNNYYIKNDVESILNNSFGDLILSKSSRNYKWNKQYSKLAINKNDFDLLHPTYFHPYVLKFLKKPFVLTVHDMTYEALPQFFPPSDALPYHKRLMMERADKIIAISETTKQDILKYSNIKEDKIEVIHHGIDSKLPIYQSIESLPEHYILYVGDRQNYKNFHIVAEAFKVLQSNHPYLKLVLAGGGKLLYGDSEFLLRNNILDKTVHVSATDQQLNTLYKNALCFVYPSLYEGFGLPILEAFKNDCPVLLSNCSCFEEIAGSAAEYFEAKSLNSLVTKIESIISSEIIRKNMTTLGYQRLKNYSIDLCLEKTLSVYKSIS